MWVTKAKLARICEPTITKEISRALTRESYLEHKKLKRIEYDLDKKVAAEIDRVLAMLVRDVIKEEAFIVRIVERIKNTQLL